MVEWQAVVNMKKSWTEKWGRKPTQDDVVEALGDAIINGDRTKIATIFDIQILKVPTHG